MRGKVTHSETQGPRRCPRRDCFDITTDRDQGSAVTETDPAQPAHEGGTGPLDRTPTGSSGRLLAEMYQGNVRLHQASNPRPVKLTSLLQRPREVRRPVPSLTLGQRGTEPPSPRRPTPAAPSGPSNPSFLEHPPQYRSRNECPHKRTGLIERRSGWRHLRRRVYRARGARFSEEATTPWAAAHASRLGQLWEGRFSWSRPAEPPSRAEPGVESSRAELRLVRAGRETESERQRPARWMTVLTPPRSSHDRTETGPRSGGDRTMIGPRSGGDRAEIQWRR